MAGIFKAYDIRGIYGTQLTEALANAIGRAFVTFLKCKKVRNKVKIVNNC